MISEKDLADLRDRDGYEDKLWEAKRFIYSRVTAADCEKWAEKLDGGETGGGGVMDTRLATSSWVHGE